MDNIFIAALSFSSVIGGIYIFYGKEMAIAASIGIGGAILSCGKEIWDLTKESNELAERTKKLREQMANQTACISLLEEKEKLTNIRDGLFRAGQDSTGA